MDRLSALSLLNLRIGIVMVIMTGDLIPHQEVMLKNESSVSKTKEQTKE